MKQLFKKYFSSTLRPNEFGDFTKFILDKRNEIAIYGEMKPIWNHSLSEVEELPGPDVALLQQFNIAILKEERKSFQ